MYWLALAKRKALSRGKSSLYREFGFPWYVMLTFVTMGMKFLHGMETWKREE
jgi:uncharacterized protein YcgL (UPF0745 family)